jgi:phage gpG-like protein
LISADLFGEAPALDQLRAMRDAANQGIARAITKLGVDLENNIQRNKLSGQVLRTRSGSLRQSIAVGIDASGAASAATVSSDLDYASAHEFGFTGTLSVPASLRRIKEAFGRPIAAKTIGVGAHSRRMDLPKRSFLRSALDDMAPDIGAGIEDALRRALIR